MQVIGRGHGLASVGRGTITLDEGSVTVSNRHGTVAYKLSDVMQAHIVEGGAWSGGSFMQILASGQAGTKDYDTALKLPNVVVFKKEQLPEFRAFAAEVLQRKSAPKPTAQPTRPAAMSPNGLAFRTLSEVNALKPLVLQAMTLTYLREIGIISMEQDRAATKALSELASRWRANGE